MDRIPKGARAGRGFPWDTPAIRTSSEGESTGQRGLAAIANGAKCPWLNSMKFMFHLHDVSCEISQHSWPRGSVATGINSLLLCLDFLLLSNSRTDSVCFGVTGSLQTSTSGKGLGL